MADWKEQSRQVWNKLEKRQKYTIIITAVLLTLAILGGSYWWGNRPDMVPLFTGMEAKDAGEVAAKLKEMKIKYEPQESSNRTAILVPSKDVHNARIELATLGLPRGQKGFEIFDQNKLGVTEFQNKVNYLQALQGELTRTIEQMAEVEKARVHIVLPEDSLYKKNEKPATASIMLKLKPAAELSKQQVKGIVNLASHSIQGLKPENITIVDVSGKVLNNSNEQDDSVGTVTLTQLQMTKKVQDNLQNDVQTLLDQVLGAGKAVARVNVELNFDQRTTDRQSFEPVVDDKGIIRSSQESNESYKGTGNTSGGPAGTTSNIPGYVANNNTTQSEYEKKEVTRNYEINETKEKVIAAPGSIKRLTVAVLVDEKINKTQQDSLLKAVSSSIGFNATRGDAISVESLPFSTELMDKQLKEEEELAKQKMYMWIAIGVLALLLILGIVLVILRRRKQRMLEEAAKQRELESAMMRTSEGGVFVASGETAEEELTPEQKALLTEREAIEKLIQTRPEDVAQLVRTWLAEE